MSAAGATVSTATGAVLVLVSLLDVFATLFSRAEQHTFSHALIRAAWWICHRVPRRNALPLAGPISFLIVIASWAIMLASGWALIYWPGMPAGFLHTAHPDTAGSSLFDSLYFSLVTLATLGYGDISPASEWSRIAAPIESLLGLGLLTASVSWLLSIFPVLSRRRALAYEISLLEAVRRDPTDAGPPSPLPASVYADLTSRVVAGERDLIAFPITYYFHEDDPRFALPQAMLHLHKLAEQARTQKTCQDAHFHGGLLLRAIDDFAASIAIRFHLPSNGSTHALLDAYARDHTVRSKCSDKLPADGGRLL